MINYEMQRNRIKTDMKKKIHKIRENGTMQEKNIRTQASLKLARIDKLEKQQLKSCRDKNKNQIVPIFYASNAKYLPYLSVSMQSLKENANKGLLYKIYILHSGITNEEQKHVLEFNEDWFNVSFVDVSEKLNIVKDGLQLRDYYTGETYYRIFIANMFEQYDKALYLDSDTIVLGDISVLYNYDLKDNYVGAVPDKVVGSHPIFQKYCREVLGIEPQNYFNAGILLMNLKKFRKDDFYNQFKSLLLEYKFCVAQDQDYLNVICKDQVKYLPYSWNTMPVGGESKILPNLIHYNLTMKPWHYADVAYAKYFWKYAQQNSYNNVIRKEFGEHTSDRKKEDDKTEEHLLSLAMQEINREDNFIKTRKAQNKQDYDVFEALFLSDDDLFEEANYTTVGAKN